MLFPHGNQSCGKAISIKETKCISIKFIKRRG